MSLYQRLNFLLILILYIYIIYFILLFYLYYLGGNAALHDGECGVFFFFQSFVGFVVFMRFHEGELSILQFSPSLNGTGAGRNGRIVVFCFTNILLQFRNSVQTIFLAL